MPELLNVSFLNTVVSNALGLTVALPLLGFAWLCGASMCGRLLSERLAANLASVVVWFGLIASIIVAVVLAYGPQSALTFDWSFAAAPLSIDLWIIADVLSVTMLVCSNLVVLVVSNFSKTYLHKESGYQRFFTLLMLFVGGINLVLIAGSLEVMLVGWELVGVSSALLIGFFQLRKQPVVHGLYAFVTYRVCDLGLILAVVMWPMLAASHHLPVWGTAGLETASPWLITLIGLACLWAASGKSALIPWSGWLPRALEGPTPSTAIFYGALSVHAGAYLMLRVWPLIGSSSIVMTSVIAIGGATACYGALMVRTRADVKTQLGYATMTQIGLIFVEIGFGLHLLPIIHMVGHVLLRTYQFLCAPSVLHYSDLWHGVREQGGNTDTMAGGYSAAWAKWIHRFALREFYIEGTVRGVAQSIMNASRTLASWDQRFLQFCMGPHGTPALSTSCIESLAPSSSRWLPSTSYFPESLFTEAPMSLPPGMVSEPASALTTAADYKRPLTIAETGINQH